MENLNLEEVKKVDIKEVETMDSTDNIAINHHQRHKQLKQILKSQKIPIKNSLDFITGYTNQYKVQRNKEKNIKNWHERVLKSHEMGEKIHRYNTELNYRQMIEENEKREENYKKNLIDLYGKEDGEKMYLKHLEKLERRSVKKYGI